MQPTITATLEAIREKLDDADSSSNQIGQIGDILIALDLITEVLEAQQRQLDRIREMFPSVA